MRAFQDEVKPRTRRKYSEFFKKKTVKDLVVNNLTFWQGHLKHGIPTGTLQLWHKKYYGAVCKDLRAKPLPTKIEPTYGEWQDRHVSIKGIEGLEYLTT